MQPCLVPVFTSKASDMPPPWLTLQLEPSYWHLTKLTNLCGTP